MVKFEQHESDFTFRMACGHAMRKGHSLTGHWIEDSGIRTLIRTCCE